VGERLPWLEDGLEKDRYDQMSGLCRRLEDIELLGVKMLYLSGDNLRVSVALLIVLRI